MQKIDLKEVKQIQLEILEYVTQYCEENKLRYYLAYGTLIGAVRHNGFIPWDDDIDIAMPRPDYEKLAKEFKDVSGNYKIIDHTHADYSYPFLKVSDTKTLLIEKNNIHFKNVGVNIDIFPIDGVSSDVNQREKQLKKITKIKNLFPYWLSPIHSNRKWYKNFLLKTLRIIDYNVIVNKIISLSTRNAYEESETVGMIVWGECEATACVSKTVFDNYILEVFEDKEYRIPKGFDEWLTRDYGDYMKLPPEEERVSHHEFEAYYL